LILGFKCEGLGVLSLHRAVTNKRPTEYWWGSFVSTTFLRDHIRV